MFDSDLNVFYPGGSGGYYFLHSLLLMNQHYCLFGFNNEGVVLTATNDPHPDLRITESTYNNIKDPSWPDYNQYLLNGNCGNAELIDAECKWAFNPEVSPTWYDKELDLVRSYQWNIDPLQWKNTEVPPSNKRTISAACVSRKYRIFYSCNVISHWIGWPGKKILLFTDLETQIRMSMYKRAWLYNNTTSHPISITKGLLKNAKTYNGHRVSADMYRALQYADQVVYLQDYVKSMLNSEDESQKKFTQFWLGLHPADLLRRCNLG